MKTIVILHPFTPEAAGVVEAAVPAYHSQPHAKALMTLATSAGYKCSMDYFTSKWFRYTQNNGSIQWNFYPVTVQLNGNHRKWLKQKSNSCLRHYKKYTPDVTIINMSAHASLFCYELSKILRIKEKPYVAMLGGQHYSDSPWIKEYYQHAHHIIVHTHLQKQQMEQMELFRDKQILVMPLGVDTTHFCPVEKPGFTNDPRLLYVGKITPWKRVHLAIDAIRLLIDQGYKKASLTIIGPVISGEYMNVLQAQVQKNKLTGNIHFRGFMEHRELQPYFQQSDLLLLPSDKETFGMVMIESMSCGTPVAAIDCPGGPAEVIDNNMNGILSSTENYARDILNLVGNSSRLSEMKRNARRKVIEKYSMDVTNAILENSVSKALSGI